MVVRATDYRTHSGVMLAEVARPFTLGDLPDELVVLCAHDLALEPGCEDGGIFVSPLKAIVLPLQVGAGVQTFLLIDHLSEEHRIVSNEFAALAVQLDEPF